MTLITFILLDYSSRTDLEIRKSDTENWLMKTWVFGADFEFELTAWYSRLFTTNIQELPFALPISVVD